MQLHPIPPGLWCVPSALVAITGADFNAVIHPALNRHDRNGTLTGLVTGATVSAAVTTLLELGYRVARYSKDDVRARVSTWAKRSSERYPGYVLFVSVSDHVVVIKDGNVYDSWMPHGEPGATHPYNTALVDKVYVVRR